MRRLLSTKDKVEIFKSRFFKCFSRNGEKYKAKRIGKRAKPWPTPTLMSNR